MSDRANPPVLRLVRGEPTADELAALVAVLAVRARTARQLGAEAAPPRALWRDPAALLGGPLAAGPGAWRASGLPR